MAARRETENGGRTDNVNPSPPQFFNVFLPPLGSPKLLIPPDYIKFFSRTIKEKIILKDLSSRVWHVSVERTRDGAFIKDGWQNFVDYHCLKGGEFLVFRYDGNYSFVVKVFGTDGCKKETRASSTIAECIKIEENTE